MTDTAFIVSTYLSPPGPKAFTARRHDQNVALWTVTPTRITLVRYWELERLSGYKHHELPLYDPAAAPGSLIEELVAQEGLSAADIAEVWGTPGLDRGRVLPPFDRQGLPVHSLAHLFSGLCLDNAVFQRDTIVALAMDGGPDHTLEDEPLGERWYAGAVSRRGQVELIAVESPGLLWQAAQRHLVLEPGTLMALAQASRATIECDTRQLLDESYLGGFAQMGRCYRLVGALIESVRTAVGDRTEVTVEGELSPADQVASAVAKVIQAVSVRIARRNVDRLLAMADVDASDAYLSLSGGYALNCPTNSRLMSRYGFRGLLAPPCANDSGQALGIGLLGFHALGMLRDRQVVTGLPYAGESRTKLSVALGRWDRRVIDVQRFDEEDFVKDLQRQPVAWVDGAAEVGPRALGHRSLLGDPRQPATKRFLNTVKERQWWRPVAPIVLEHSVTDWFVEGRPSPFMLETFQVAPEFQPLVPAILHLDGSARIQSLSVRDEPFLYRVVAAFHAATGVPMVCNTSLNGRGEPIVDDADQAIRFCVSRGIEVAYIDRQRVLLDVGRPADEEELAVHRPLASRYRDQDPRPATLFGPDVEPRVLFLLYFWPQLHRYAGSAEGRRRLASIARTVIERDPGFDARALDYLEHWRGLLSGKIAHGQVGG